MCILNIEVTYEIEFVSEYVEVKTYILLGSALPLEVCIDCCDRAVSRDNLLIEYSIL